MRRFCRLSMVVAMAGFLLAGCVQRNPAGSSAGSGNGGTQTIYTFTITPAAPQGVYAADCPVIVSGKSAVVCSINRGNTPLSGLLPIDGYAEGGGVTNYEYTVADGKVNLSWSNSSNYVPPAFDLKVTVVNP